MEDNYRYTLSYRATEAKQVMTWFQARQSGHILGLRGVGKSNFIRFLLSTETQQHYLGDDHANYIFVLVNLLALTERSEWAIFETLIDNLLAELHPPGIPSETIDEIAAAQQSIISTQNPQIALRAVKHCMTLLCQKTTRRLVFLFDEFDAVFRELPASTFRGLRAIRDAHKEQISYVVVSKHHLADLRSDLTEEVDHFSRLVNHNICGLGPYNEADTRQMIRYLAAQRTLALSETDGMRLFEQSGGHAGLLKTILNLSEDVDLSSDPKKLIQEPAIARECQKLWENLSDAEKTTLGSFSAGHPLDTSTLGGLKLRGLLRQSSTNAPAFFSPLFAAFVQSQATSSPQGTFISRIPQVVQIDGQRIETLSGQEFELLCHLYEQRGRVCSKDDLIKKLYPKAAYNTDDGSLEQHISRLRGKIEPDRSKPSHIITIRGAGYKFVISDNE